MASMLCAQIAQASELEQRVKAAFLYNVAKFVAWPASDGNPDNTIDLCILQDAAFAELLNDELAGKSIGNKPLRVHAINQFKATDDCQVFFVGNEIAPDDAQQALAITKDLPILTVGEPSAFIADGGVLHLKWENSKLRFEIAMDGVQKSRLQVSSKLLRLAEIIPPTLQ